MLNPYNFRCMYFGKKLNMNIFQIFFTIVGGDNCLLTEIPYFDSVERKMKKDALRWEWDENNVTTMLLIPREHTSSKIQRSWTRGAALMLENKVLPNNLNKSTQTQR